MVRADEVKSKIFERSGCQLVVEDGYEPLG